MREVPAGLQAVAAKMAKVGRTEYSMFRRPNWKEYTLVKYDDRKIVSRERIMVNEAEKFPSDEDFFWEPKKRTVTEVA